MGAHFSVAVAHELHSASEKLAWPFQRQDSSGCCNFPHARIEEKSVIHNTFKIYPEILMYIVFIMVEKQNGDIPPEDKMAGSEADIYELEHDHAGDYETQFKIAEKNFNVKNFTKALEPFEKAFNSLNDGLIEVKAEYIIKEAYYMKRIREMLPSFVKTLKAMKKRAKRMNDNAEEARITEEYADILVSSLNFMNYDNNTKRSIIKEAERSYNNILAIYDSMGAQGKDNSAETAERIREKKEIVASKLLTTNKLLKFV